MKKFLFPLLWIAGHSGDNAIWKKLIRVIESIYPGSEYICPVQCGVDDKEALGWDIEQLRQVTPNIRVVSAGLVNGFNYEEFSKITSEEEAIKYMDKVEPSDVLREADALVSMGGGYMFNDACYCLYLPPFYVAQKLGKPTFFNTQTFTGSDFTPATVALGEAVFNKANYISPREVRSMLNLNGRFTCTAQAVNPDFTFDLPFQPYDGDYPKESIKFNFRTDVNNESFITKIAEVADMTVEALGPVVFVPACHGRDRNDRRLHRKISEQMRHEPVLIEDEITAGQVMRILEGGLTVTDRYHTAIFSAASHTPFVPLVPDIDLKMDGLLELLTYPRPDILDLKQASVDDLFKCILGVWKQRDEIKQRLEVVVPRVKEQTTRSTSELCKSLKESL